MESTLYKAQNKETNFQSIKVIQRKKKTKED